MMAIANYLLWSCLFEAEDQCVPSQMRCVLVNILELFLCAGG